MRLFFKPESDRDEMIHGCVASLVDIYAEMDAWNTTTSPPRISALARRPLMLYRELRETSDDAGCWTLYPKHHVFLHICEETMETRVCPKLEWCYGDENETGKGGTWRSGAMVLTSLPSS